MGLGKYLHGNEEREGREHSLVGSLLAQVTGHEFHPQARTAQLVVHARSPRTWEVEAGGSRVQGHL